jgi:DNA-binding transcriptional MerR regulator
MSLKTGQVALAAGVKLTTVRFYERAGLLPNPKRSNTGYRQYSEKTITRIRFIKRAQELGFNLNEISSFFIKVSSNEMPDPDTLKSQMAEKLEVINKKIAELEDVKRNLKLIYENYPGDGSVAPGCSMLEALITAD